MYHVFHKTNAYNRLNHGVALTLRVEPKCEQTIFSRSNYQFWFATRRFGNYREVSRYRGRISANSIQKRVSVDFGSDDSGTPISLPVQLRENHSLRNRRVRGA